MFAEKDISNLLHAQKQHAVKKVIFEILQEEYKESEDLTQRITHNLITDKDFKDFYNFTPDDIKLEDYKHHETIKMEVSV